MGSAVRTAGQLPVGIGIVGATEVAARLFTAALDTCEINVIGIFDDRLGRAPARMQGVPVLGDLDALIGIARWIGELIGRPAPSALSRAGGWPKRA